MGNSDIAFDVLLTLDEIQAILDRYDSVPINERTKEEKSALKKIMEVGSTLQRIMMLGGAHDKDQ